jgi:hypothetical protein
LSIADFSLIFQPTIFSLIFLLIFSLNYNKKIMLK